MKVEVAQLLAPAKGASPPPYQLFYHGEKTSIVSQKWKHNILAVNRVSDRLMSMQLVIKKGLLSIIPAYAPQVVVQTERRTYSGKSRMR